jgi:hypothetical protein
MWLDQPAADMSCKNFGEKAVVGELSGLQLW